MHFFETKVIARYAETDQMGLVHHSNYPIWFEIGRTDFIKSLGMSYSEFEANGIYIPLIKLECSYIKPVKYEDEVTIKTFINEFTPVRIVFQYEIYKDKDLVTTGKTFHVFTESYIKPINLKKKNNNIFELINKNYLKIN